MDIDMEEQIAAEKRLGIPYHKRYSTQLMMKAYLAERLDLLPWDIWMTGSFRPEHPTLTYREQESGHAESKVLYQGKMVKIFYPGQTKSIFTVKRRYKRFLSDLKYLGVKSGVDYFLATEPHKTGELHIHSLINGVDGLDPVRDVAPLWFKRFGRVEVERFDRELGAINYLTKYITKDIYDWDIEIRNKR
jgi:hypothetical protein